MTALIDHIAAVVIGAAIILVVLALTLRTNESAIEATQVELAKADLRSLVDLVEQDFHNMGSGVGRANETTATRVVQEFGVVSGDSLFSFLGLEQIGWQLNPALFEYRWRRDGSIVFSDGTTAEAFVVERTIDDHTASFERVTAFEITLRDEDMEVIPFGSSADDLRMTRVVEVTIGVVSPVGPDDLLQQTRWSKSFLPINMDGLRQLVAVRPF